MEDIEKEFFSVHSTERLTVVDEESPTNSDFVVSYMLKQAVVHSDAYVYLLLTQRSIDHYADVASKKLGYDLRAALARGSVSAFHMTTYTLHEQALQGNAAMQAMDVALKDVEEFVMAAGAAQARRVIVLLENASMLMQCEQWRRSAAAFMASFLSGPSVVQYAVRFSGTGTRVAGIRRTLLRDCDKHMQIAQLHTRLHFDVTGSIAVHRKDKPTVARCQYLIRNHAVSFSSPGTFLHK